jgi:hypothetical protein
MSQSVSAAASVRVRKPQIRQIFSRGFHRGRSFYARFSDLDVPLASIMAP